MRFLYFSWQFLYHQFVAVAYEVLDEGVGEMAVEVELVPVLLVHVPCTRYLWMTLAQFYGIVRVALQHKPFGVVEVDHGKYLVSHAEGEGGLGEREILGRCR